MSEKVYAVVPPTPGTEPYWEGAKAGKLMVEWCQDCKKPHHYPRGVCPHCMSSNLEWKQAKGTGEIYTYSIMHAAKPAYVIAYVTLDEGVTMMTNIVDVDPAKVKVGQKVKVVFKPSEGGGKLPCFTPSMTKLDGRTHEEDRKGETPMNLEGKAGIVTGAGRGIGRGIALLMAREGAKVVVNDPGAGRNGEVTTERPADEVVAEIAKAGGKALANYNSVADYVSAGRMVRQCADNFGRIDFVVNAAGVLRERMIWNMTEDDFDTVIGVHLKGTWNMSHHAIKLMRNERFGRIVNFSSDAFKGSVGQCNYAAAKAGVIGLTRTIASASAAATASRPTPCAHSPPPA